MNYFIISYCKPYLKQDGPGLEITKDSSLVIDADGDLKLYTPQLFPSCAYLVSAGKVHWQYSMKYVFTNNVDFKEEIIIDFDKKWSKKKYVEKYLPKFERILDQVKIRIEQDNVKKLLDNI